MYPPTPTTTSGLNSFTTFFAALRLARSLNGALRSFRMFRRLSCLCRPTTGRPTILYPAAGTFSISIFPSAPTKRISVSGFSSFSLSAMEMAGKMCPPVPPPLTMALMALYSLLIRLRFASTRRRRGQLSVRLRPRPHALQYFPLHPWRWTAVCQRQC